MNQDEIIDTTGCPKCAAAPHQPCVNADGSKRRRNHVERLYRAQDILNGKPDRQSGKVHQDHMADRRCPICFKLLKSPRGATDHITHAHELTRLEAKEVRREYRHKHGHQPQKRRDEDEFDLIDDGDVV